MALEEVVNESVQVPIQDIVEKTAIRRTKETHSFGVILGTRAVSANRLQRLLDADGVEINASISQINFDFAEILGKVRNGITGMDIYNWLKAEFDERDPI